VSREDWSAAKGTAMHLVPDLSRSLHEDPPPGELLGFDHPLVRTLARTSTLRTHALVVTGLMACGSLALLDGVSASLALVIAAAVVLWAMACRAVALIWRMRDEALDVIIAGGGDLPIEAVRRRQARLLRRPNRNRLAASFDDMRREAARPIGRFARTSPIFNRSIVTVVGAELAAVALLLREDNACARGVAMAERLLLDGGSCLYRDDVETLRQEVRRVRYHLAARNER
jgi:hypothetical protein